jgi:hypothetical protein
MFGWNKKSKTLNEKEKNQAIVNGAREAVASLGDLMEQFPTAFLDTSKLPLPKADMKTALKIVWITAPNDQMRNHVEVGFVLLSHFQDGIGDKPLKLQLPDVADLKKDADKHLAVMDRWLLVEKKSQAEMTVLSEEFKQFKKQQSTK